MNMALTMVVLVGVVLHVMAPRHHEDTAIQPHDVDLGAVKP
jgi:hypothetical protein